MSIPSQALGKDICSNCDQPVHLINAQLEPIWVHSHSGIQWCPLKAVPANQPWPESA